MTDMEDLPGKSCHCNNDKKEQAPYCSNCGTRKQWINKGPHSQVFECPSCN